MNAPRTVRTTTAQQKKFEKIDEPVQWLNGRTHGRVWPCRAHQRPFPYDAWSACPCTSVTAPPSSPAPRGRGCRRDAIGTSLHGVGRGGAARGRRAFHVAAWYPLTSGRCEFGGGERSAAKCSLACVSWPV
jgi:hypothetical protein